MELWFRKFGAFKSKNALEKIRKISPEKIKSVAVIRHAAIGDMVILRPFLVELKKYFANTKITLSLLDCAKYGAPIDLVDNIHMFYKKRNGKRTNFLQRYKNIKELGSHDIIFDLADTSLSGLIVLLNKSKIKAGFPYRDIKNKILFDVSVKRSDFILETENMLHLLHMFGAKTEFPFNYAYPKTSKKEKSILYFPSASNIGKMWPRENFIELISKMIVAYPHYDHIVMDGINEDEKVDDIITACNKNANNKNLLKQEALPLEKVFDFLAKSSLVISNDTGIRNMAISVNTSTIGFFFSTVPYRYWPRDGLHEVVFNVDGSIPSAEKSYNVISSHLNKIAL